MKKSKNTKELVVDLTTVTLNKVNEVELAIAKAKQVWNSELEDVTRHFTLTDREKHLIKVSNRWFRRIIRAIKKLLSTIKWK